jgi:hypothetical protein
MHELNKPGRDAAAAASGWVTGHAARPSDRHGLAGRPSASRCLKAPFTKNTRHISGFIRRVFSVNQAASL